MWIFLRNITIFSIVYLFFRLGMQYLGYGILYLNSLLDSYVALNAMRYLSPYLGAFTIILSMLELSGIVVFTIKCSDFKSALICGGIYYLILAVVEVYTYDTLLGTFTLLLTG